ncbi:MAG: hypothetical protein ACRCU6_01685 [Fusobacteriaceae bacterium]
MKKILITAFLIISTGIIASPEKIYNFQKLKDSMTKEGYSLDYAKKDVGFNFKKDVSHVELVGYKNYAETTEALSKMINLIYKNGLTMVPNESDIGNGIFVFTYPSKPDYFALLIADFDNNVIVNSYDKGDQIKKNMEHLKNAHVKK